MTIQFSNKKRPSGTLHRSKQSKMSYLKLSIYLSIHPSNHPAIHPSTVQLRISLVCEVFGRAVGISWRTWSKPTEILAELANSTRQRSRVQFRAGTFFVLHCCCEAAVLTAAPPRRPGERMETHIKPCVSCSCRLSFESMLSY